MRKAVFLATALIAILGTSGTAMWGVFAQKSSENRAMAASLAPALTGWMQNFTPADPVGPAPKLEVLKKDGTVLPLDQFRGKLVSGQFLGDLVRALYSGNAVTRDIAEKTRR